MIDKLNRSRKAPRRLSVFGLAVVVSLAMGAVVASGASALSFSWEPASQWAQFGTQSTGLAAETASGPEWAVRCEKGTGSTSFGSGTSGSTQLIYQKCKWSPSNFNCTSPGLGAGEIRTNVLALEPVYLDAAKTKFGLKATPQAGAPVAEFTCGGFYKYTWTGSVLGQITSPALNVSSSVFTLSFSGGSGTQQYEQVEGAGTKYHLSSQTGSTVEPMSLASTLTLTLLEGKKGKFIP
jgi:hypothetical protein